MFVGIEETPLPSVTKAYLWYVEQDTISDKYKSGLLKLPGGGITTLDFMFNMYDGESGISFVRSLIVSVVIQNTFCFSEQC